MSMMNDPSRMIGQRATVTTRVSVHHGTIAAAGLGGVLVNNDGRNHHIPVADITDITIDSLRHRQDPA